MSRARRVRPLAGYRLRVEFTDGLCGDIDLSDRLFGSMFEPLKDERLFAQAFIDDYGAIAWPNGADLAPDALHASIQRQTEHPRG